MINIKKYLLILLFLGLFLIPDRVIAKQNVNLYLFYGEECSVCEKERNFLNQLQTKYPDLNIYTYEVWHNPENSKLLEEVGDLLDVKVSGVPFTVVGDRVLRGFNDSIGNRIESLVIQYQKDYYNDKVGRYLQVETALDERQEEKPITSLSNKKEIKEKAPEKNLNRDIIFITIISVLVLIFGILLFLFNNPSKKQHSI